MIQILKLDHKTFVSEMISGRIFHLDDLLELEDEDSDTSNTSDTLGDGPFSGHIHLGSTQSLTMSYPISPASTNSFHQRASSRPPDLNSGQNPPYFRPSGFY
ncbi:hypothetical protein DFH29DRAFT_1010636 [Suillus ampliporus]|nr:hypothetical protein DFH29DRAFT_1010636 [Suillus ampliporus]